MATQKTTLQKYGHVVVIRSAVQSNSWQKKIERQAVDWSQVLKLESSQAELFVFNNSGAGDGNRTHVRKMGDQDDAR